MIQTVGSLASPRFLVDTFFPFSQLFESFLSALLLILLHGSDESLWLLDAVERVEIVAVGVPHFRGHNYNILVVMKLG